MEGMCKCGGHISESRHKVYTDRGAAEWLNEVIAKLPITVEQSRCTRCGRQMTRIIGKDGNVLKAWG